MEEKRRSILHCQIAPHHKEGSYYTHFMANPNVVQLHDETSAVYQAEVEQCEDSPGVYWGWWENQKQAFTMVYRTRSILNMCFPYGFDIEEKKGRGHAVPVKVTLGPEVLPPKRAKR